MSIRILIISALLLLPVGASSAPVAPGNPAPPLTLPTLPASENTLSLKGLQGNVVYVDFWASWCGPCRVSFPIIEAIYQELGPRGFEVVAVNVDEFEEDALDFLEQLPVSYRVVRDAEGATPEAYGIIGMPTGFLLDRNGIVRKVHQGFRKSDGEKLRAEVLELLEAAP